jgi:hypothetical protein
MDECDTSIKALLELDNPTHWVQGPNPERQIVFLKYGRNIAQSANTQSSKK